MLLSVFAFVGGLALFLYGMQLMSEGLQQAAGEKLQKILEALTKVTIMGVALGAGVTAILQSSSATTVMTVGLVNAGLMNLQQAFGIVMGANIGTTITAQLIAFKLTDYITLLLAVGFAMQALGRRRQVKYLGQVLLGFGILMLGMSMMGKAVLPLREYAGFVEFIATFGTHPLLGLGVGIVMTVLIQSSSATIGILIAMASQGLIPLEGAIPVLLGDNIGTCITAIIATIGAHINAKRVALAHVLFNLIGSLIFILFMDYFVRLVLAVSPANDLARQIANAHTAFNVINTLVFLPFAAKYTDFIKLLLPGEDNFLSKKPEYLNTAMLETPAIAIGLAAKEVVRMGNLAKDNIAKAFAVVTTRDKADIDYVLEHEPIIDALEEEVTRYLTKMSEGNMNKELSAEHTGLMHVCADIERIGDHAETIAKRVRKMEEDPVHFSPAAQQELQELGTLVLSAYSKSLQALAENNKDLAHEALGVSHQVKILQKAIRKNHVSRLNAGTCEPVAGFVLLELLINMKRVSDHSKNISQLVLGEF
ncbi:MAG: Na/Pi cotransporter family protein [Acidaminococcaceae bacterium]|nr:Na/Pi cotransporter family protein [Acidaminococcaceae bacterium]